MPKESVFGADSDGYRVSVGWSQEQHVQLGVTGPFEIEFAAPLPAGVSVSGPYDGLWVTLDRRGLNELIRKLRRARDSAFGRDE